MFFDIAIFAPYFHTLFQKRGHRWPLFYFQTFGMLIELNLTEQDM